MSNRTCSIDGCSKPVVARGWCRKHYSQWHRQERTLVSCLADGCTKPPLVDGRCQKHDAWYRVNGDRPLSGSTCSVDQCGKPVQATGLCAAHYSRWLRHGAADATVRVWSAPYKGAQCEIENCTEPALKRGWCAMHYRRWQRHGDPVVAKLERATGIPLPDAMCDVCGVSAIKLGSRRFCSTRCSATFARTKRRKPYQEPTCPDCGISFQRATKPGVWKQVRCSECAADHKVARAREDARRRRARKASAPIEQFTDREIFERDNWTCGICDQPVDGTLRHPNPLSPSIDHVLPLSKGGHHTQANCQLAHLTCNVRKSASLPAA